MDTLTGIKVFLQVVEAGSFVGAADRLDVSTAMVSKHVMNVEGRLGVRLLNRNSRTLSLTEPGRVYFERCRSILSDLEETELELGSLRATARGTLRITCPSWFAGQCLADILARYRQRYPDVVVDASFEDRVVDLVDEGYDLALRVSPDPRLLPSGLVARAVKSMSFYVAASREYLKRHGSVPSSTSSSSSCPVRWSRCRPRSPEAQHAAREVMRDTLRIVGGSEPQHSNRQAGVVPSPRRYPPAQRAAASAPDGSRHPLSSERAASPFAARNRAHHHGNARRT
ncbi:MAG: LysR family transcriptional regulator [Steroidobacteraceae bacterium]